MFNFLMVASGFPIIRGLLGELVVIVLICVALLLVVYVLGCALQWLRSCVIIVGTTLQLFLLRKGGAKSLPRQWSLQVDSKQAWKDFKDKECVLGIIVWSLMILGGWALWFFKG